MLTSLFPWASAMKWFVLGLMALGLFLGIAGQAKAQVIVTTLDVPGSTLTLACGINASGWIVGQYDAGGTTHGFLATPVPEPTSLTLISIGALSLIGYGWRRRKPA